MARGEGALLQVTEICPELTTFPYGFCTYLKETYKKQLEKSPTNIG